MPDRAPSDTVQFKLRMPERLRARLERAAEESGGSINGEINRRLEQSLGNDAMGGIIFSKRTTYEIFDECARLLCALEVTAGREWDDGTVEGRDVLLTAFKSMAWMLEHGPSLIAGQPLPVLRTLEDRIGLAALSNMAANFQKYREGLEAAIVPGADVAPTAAPPDPAANAADAPP